MKYIVTDYQAVLTVHCALNDLGNKPYIAALLFDGPPGTGKSFLAAQVSKFLNATLLDFQCKPGYGEEQFLSRIDPQTGQISHGILAQAILASHKGPTVLKIDEMDKGPRSADFFWLNFLQDNLLNEPHQEELRAKQENLLIILTKNDVRNLEQPLLRRCRCVTFRYPTIEEETKIILQYHPYLLPDSFRFILDIVQEIRNNPTIVKKPSSPEIVRLIQDLLSLLAIKVSPLEIGRYFLNGLLTFPEDLDKLKLNNVRFGTLCYERFSNISGHPQLEFSNSGHEIANEFLSQFK